MRRNSELYGVVRFARVLVVLGSALACCAATVALPVTASADEFVAHRVTYTVTADQPVDVDIYYRDVDPPTWEVYSHNPFQRVDEQKDVHATASVVRAAPAELHADTARVSIFRNQTTTSRDDPDPVQSASTVTVGRQCWTALAHLVL
jgi:hypothetical protein